jgi:dihydrolipoamide dehydrogenase
MAESFDAVIIGAGPAGEHALGWMLDGGLERVALVEQELIGGECSNWACIPTKTLLRPGEAQHAARRVAGVSEPGLDWQRVSAYRDWMTSAGDDSKRVQGYEDRGVTVIKGAGRLAGPGRVEVDGRVLETERVLLATGSTTAVPPIEGLEENGYWTNREASAMHEVPASAVVLGGGAVGVELAQIMRRFGAAVTLVQGPDRLLNREDPRVSELVAEQLGREGVELRLGRRAKAVKDGSVSLDDGSEIAGERLVVATGRRPRTDGLGLESVGIEAKRGIPVDERCRAADGVWAIGDVTGLALFTHAGKYQGRIAVADMLGRPAKADYRSIPRVVFLDPEVAAVGTTEAKAREDGVDVAAVEIDLTMEIARPYTYEEEPRGRLGIVADRARKVLLGAWAVAPLAGEWIHQAGLAVRAEVPLDVLRDTVAQFPSFSEAYLQALRALDA